MVGVDIEIILDLKTKMVCIPIQMINEELLIFGGPSYSKSVVTYSETIQGRITHLQELGMIKTIITIGIYVQTHLPIIQIRLM